MSVKLKQYDGQNTSISDMAEACPRRKRKRKIICWLRKISLRLQKLVAGFWVWPQGATAFISLCFHLTDKKVLPQGWRHLSKNKQAHHLVFNKQLLFSDPSNRVNVDFYSWKRFTAWVVFLLSGNFRSKWKRNLKWRSVPGICNVKFAHISF